MTLRIDVELLALDYMKSMYYWYRVDFVFLRLMKFYLNLRLFKGCHFS